MSVFIVAYDLRNETGSQDYLPLWDELKRLDAHRVQDSVWLVNVNNTAKELHDHLKQCMDGDDRLLIDRFTKDHWFSNARGGTNDWLKGNPPA